MRQMAEKWSAIRTPHKWGRPVLHGSGIPGRFDEQGVDCPFVFRHNGRFYMMYVGFDGIGYQTALATSQDLLHWQHEAVILERLMGSNRWDRVGAAGSWILLESDDLFDVPRLKKVDGKYWMIYHAYPDVGYEAGGAVMGLAWCEDESLLDWHRLEEPVFTYREGADWERAGLYKCCVIEHQGRYWMFYNAKGTGQWPWREETGLAFSRDLKTWERYERNPVFPTDPERFYSRFYSDPCVKRCGEAWINFGFGFDGAHAQVSFAESDDLLHWTTHPEPWIPHGEAGELDEIHAHKSSVVHYRGVLYHFYCSCRRSRPGDPTRIEVFEGESEFRCITVATSRPIDREA